AGSGSNCASGESIDVVFEEAAPARRNHSAAGQRDRRLSVVPVLQCFGDLEWHSGNAIRKVIEWVVDVQRAAVLTTIGEGLDESTFRQQVAGHAPTTEQSVEEAALSIEQLATANWQIVHPVDRQPMWDIVGRNLVVELELLRTNIWVVVVGAVVCSVVAVALIGLRIVAADSHQSRPCVICAKLQAG